MTTPSDILIPVKRRHADSRAELETIVTRAQHWGYAEDEDLLLVRRSNKARRYFSNSRLMRPNTAYQPAIIVDDSSLQINHNAYYDGLWRRYDTDPSWQLVFSNTTMDLWYAPGGAAGGTITRGQTLEVKPEYFWVNPAQRDSFFRVSSSGNQNSIHMTGDNGYIGLNTTPDTRWSSANTVIEHAGSTYEYAEFAVSNTFSKAINCYYDGSYKKKVAGSTTRLSCTPSGWSFYYDFDGATADGVINYESLLDIYGTEVIVNNAGKDIDTRVETENQENTLFVWGEKDNVGIHTNTPLDNVGTANGDYAQYGYGLHVKAPSGTFGLLVVEGGVDPESGPPSSALILCDNNADTDEKTLMLECTNERAYFSSINDDVSASLTYNVFSIISMQLSNGYVGIGKTPSDRGILSISLSTDDLTFIDADDTVNSVGPQAAVIEVDVGSAQNKYIAVYDQPV